jgi:PAS domain S-box-containing protein
MYKLRQMNLNPVTLSFRDDNEKKYQEYFFRESLFIFRIAYILTAFLYAAFAFADIYAAHHLLYEFHLIRFGIVVPLLLLTLALSYFGFFKKIWQALVFLGFISAGVGIIVMLVLYPENDPYYMGLMLVFLGGYFFIRLRFILAAIGGTVLLVLFYLLMLVFSGFSSTQIFIFSTFYLSAHLIGMFASYLVELSNRGNFILLQELDKKTRELVESNNTLETKVKQRTTELIANEEKFRHMVEEINDVIFELDKQGVITYISPVIQSVSGYLPGYFENHNFLDFFTSADTSSEQSEKLFLKQGSSFSGEFLFRNKSNEMRWVRSSAKTMLADEGVQGFRGIIQDISRQKEDEKLLLQALEKVKSSDALKSEFISNISHQIRTPLNGILGASQIIARLQPTQQEKEISLMMLQKSSDRLVQTITDIMDISVISSGNLETNDTPVRLAKLFGRIEEMFASQVEEAGLEFVLNHPLFKYEVNLVTDFELLFKVLGHMLSNAIKFTHEGSIETGCHLKEQRIEFYVKDTGIGIPEEFWPQVFERFMRNNPVAGNLYDGSGLGLAISKEIVDALGGKIWFEATKGQGTTFFVSLPADVTEIIEDTPEVDEVNTPQPLVLLAAGDQALKTLMEIFLSKMGIRNISAANGKEALRIFTKQPEVSLVITSLKLPLMNGFELRTAIAGLNSSVPVLAVSVITLDDDEDQLLFSGFNGIIRVPFTQESFKEVLTGFLKKKKPLKHMSENRTYEKRK